MALLAATNLLKVAGPATPSDTGNTERESHDREVRHAELSHRLAAANFAAERS